MRAIIGKVAVDHDIYIKNLLAGVMETCELFLKFYFISFFSGVSHLPFTNSVYSK